MSNNPHWLKADLVVCVNPSLWSEWVNVSSATSSPVVSDKGLLNGRARVAKLQQCLWYSINIMHIPVHRGYMFRYFRILVVEICVLLVECRHVSCWRS